MLTTISAKISFEEYKTLKYLALVEGISLSAFIKKHLPIQQKGGFFEEIEDNGGKRKWKTNAQFVAHNY